MLNHGIVVTKLYICTLFMIFTPEVAVVVPLLKIKAVQHLGF
jgi:hypothetical protein